MALIQFLQVLLQQLVVAVEIATRLAVMEVLHLAVVVMELMAWEPAGQLISHTLVAMPISVPTMELVVAVVVLTLKLLARAVLAAVVREVLVLLRPQMEP